jgi:amino-acid N-acetyltransferase
MLFVSISDIYEKLLMFVVAEEEGTVIGCCSLGVLWENLAEIKSLAVDKDHFSKGIGRALTLACMEKARKIY